MSAETNISNPLIFLPPRLIVWQMHTFIAKTKQNETILIIAQGRNAGFKQSRS